MNGLMKITGRNVLTAFIGVLGILGAQREKVWANDIALRETIYNTDFAVGAVGGHGQGPAGPDDRSCTPATVWRRPLLVDSRICEPFASSQSSAARVQSCQACRAPSTL